MLLRVRSGTLNLYFSMANCCIYMAGTQLLGAGNMKDCLRHFKYKFQSDKGGQTSGVVNRNLWGHSYAFKLWFARLQWGKAPKMSEERADLGCWLERPNAAEQGFRVTQLRQALKPDPGENAVLHQNWLRKFLSPSLFEPSLLLLWFYNCVIIS